MLIYILFFILNILAGALFIPSWRNGKKIYLWFTFIEMALLGGLRGISVGTDTVAYHDIFYKIEYVNTLSGLLNLREEFGYVIINKVVALLGGGPQLVIFICSAFIAGGFILFIAKHSDNVFFSCFLLITLMLYFTSFNVIRQYMATVVIINGFTFLKNKQIFRYVLICLLAGLFHSTAILWVFLGFVPLVKWNASKIIWLMVAMFLVVVFARQIIDLIVKIFPQYASYLESKYFQPSKGIMMPVVYCAIFFVVTFILAIARPYDKQDLIYIYVISALTLMLTLVGLTTASIADRLAWYVSPFLVLLIPKATAYLPKSGETVMQLAIGTAGIAYFIYCLIINWQGIMPYVFYWN